jgi:hypothetical protein
MGWSSHDPSQLLFDRLGMSGAFPRLDGRDGISLVVDNEASNKIDSFLEVEAEYHADVACATGRGTGRLAVTLTNHAPSSGLPEVVLGNTVGAPVGSNRMRLSVYSAMPTTKVVLDGEPMAMEFDTAFGWYVASGFVVIRRRSQPSSNSSSLESCCPAPTIRQSHPAPREPPCTDIDHHVCRVTTEDPRS